MPRRITASIAFLLVACQRGEPPAPKGIDGAVSPLPPPPGAGGHVTTNSDPTPAPHTPPPADAAVGSTVVSEADAGVDPGTLEQTKDKPEASGAKFEARVAALWNGIVNDDPERAMPFFFPLTAYEQVKAISNAGADWRRRLITAYKRDIHALHKRLGEHAADAKFVRIEVPQDRAKWVEPTEEYNKIGYYRVYGTRLVYEIEGKERSIEVTSLISWRGDWYVVHLTGFK
jgi:hypothetical protein